MNDRELLEMAAKAISLKGEWSDYWGFREERPSIDGYGSTFYKWNPLEDDGDAFRLQVDIGISIRRGLGIVSADYPHFDPGTFDEYRVICQSVLDDYRLSARRAIVRAAAEIGKSMP